MSSNFQCFWTNHQPIARINLSLCETRIKRKLFFSLFAIWPNIANVDCLFYFWVLHFNKSINLIWHWCDWEKLEWDRWNIILGCHSNKSTVFMFEKENSMRLYVEGKTDVNSISVFWSVNETANPTRLRGEVFIQYLNDACQLNVVIGWLRESTLFQHFISSMFPVLFFSASCWMWCAYGEKVRIHLYLHSSYWIENTLSVYIARIRLSDVFYFVFDVSSITQSWQHVYSRTILRNFNPENKTSKVLWNR